MEARTKGRVIVWKFRQMSECEYMKINIPHLVFQQDRFVILANAGMTQGSEKSISRENLITEYIYLYLLNSH